MAVSTQEDDERQRKNEGQKLRTMKLIRSVFEMADADHNGQLTLQESERSAALPWNLQGRRRGVFQIQPQVHFRM